MGTAAGDLKELHRLHLELETVRAELDKGPKRIQQQRNKVEKCEREIEAARERVKQMKMAADQKSLQLKTNEAKISELKAKLNAATNNKEFDIIKSQIDADSMANSVLEDEILEAYEKIDQAETEIDEFQKRREVALENEKQIKAEVEAEAPGLREKAGELESTLAAAESKLPAKVLAVYRRLVGAHGASALAEVDDNACTACYARLTPNMKVELNVGKYIFCRSCGRLLYKPS